MNRIKQIVKEIASCRKTTLAIIDKLKSQLKDARYEAQIYKEEARTNREMYVEMYEQLHRRNPDTGEKVEDYVDPYDEIQSENIRAMTS